MKKEIKSNILCAKKFHLSPIQKLPKLLAVQLNGNPSKPKDFLKKRKSLKVATTKPLN